MSNDLNDTEKSLIKISKHPDLTNISKESLIRDLAFPDQTQDYAVGTTCAVCPPEQANPIFAALPGTPLLNDDGSPRLNEKGEQDESSAGHVWYMISDGNKELSYGFAPIKTGIMGSGEISRKDTSHYQSPFYSRTLEITKAQFDSLKKFGEDTINNESSFSLYYNGITNSCIDFTWNALNQSGLKVGFSWIDSGRNISEKLQGKFEGTVKVIKNIPSIKKIKAPFPNSNLNNEIINEAPAVGLLQFLLTDDNHTTPQETV